MAFPMVNNYVMFTSQLLIVMRLVFSVRFATKLGDFTSSGRRSKRYLWFVKAVTSVQKALADNTPNRLFASLPYAFNHFLMSTAAEGRGGGGGHGPLVPKDRQRNDFAAFRFS
ncbi:hypothetical protein [Flavobacterium sp. XGLA_31]|uniref:hypothetical protein n=1 Tax=Flavobacterium sp. XGLA_31 TaxID=3447666 RepID=UPI003F315FEF